MPNHTLIGLVHSATKEHPANLIMQNFYHRMGVKYRPYILGLTASPLVGKDVKKLR